MSATISSVIQRKLETTGNNSEMAVDGSSTPVVFTYTVPTGKTLSLYEITGRIQVPDSSGTPGKAPGFCFGEDSGVLTNGVQLYIRDDSLNTVLDFTVDGAVKRNSDWGNLCGGNVGQFGEDAYSFDIDMVKAFGEPIAVPAGYQVVAKVRDDLTSIADSFQMSVAGTVA